MKINIGLDIGGTKITGIAWNGKSIVRELTIVTPKTLFEFKRSLGKLVSFLRGRDKIGQLGIGMAGLIDKKKRVAISSPNIRYIKNFSFAEVSQNLGLKKVLIDNDASCLLKAEVKFGQAKRFKNVIGLIFGTGVGGAMYLNGKHYRGAENLGGEVGKIPLVTGSSWEREYQKYRDRRDFKSLSRLTAKGLYTLVEIFNPDTFVFGGSVAVKEYTKFLPAAKTELKFLLAAEQKMPEIFVSKIDNAGAIGAATLTD